MALLAFIISLFVRNNLEAAHVSSLFNLDITRFAPERAEKSIYFTLVFLFPFLYPAVFLLIRKIGSVPVSHSIMLKLEALLITAGAFFIAYVSFGLVDYEYTVFTLLDNKIITALFFCFLVFCVFRKRSLRGLPFWVLCALTAALFAALYKAYYPFIYGAFSEGLDHFVSYYTPIYKTISGLAPAVDFNNIYGFYPYIYSFILKACGGFGFFKINYIFMLMVLLCLGLALAVLLLNVKNKALVLIAFAAYAGLFCLFPVINGNFYLQFLPHRVLFIMLIIFLASLYIRAKKNSHKKTLVAAGYFTAFLAVIWNFESGFIVLASWALLPIFLALPDIRADKKAFVKTCVINASAALLCLAAAFIAIELLTYVQGGGYIGLKRMFFAQAAFYDAGYFMLPMRFGDAWAVPAAVYMIGIMKALNTLLPFGLPKDAFINIRKAAFYFFLSFIGLGVFVYYQGRSHPAVLRAAIFPAFILLILFTDELWQKLRMGVFTGSFRKAAAYKFYLFLFIFCFYGAVTFSLAFGNAAARLAVLKTNHNEALSAREDYDFIARNTDAPKDIIGRRAAIFYTLDGEPDLLPFPALIDMMLKSDYEKLYNYLEQSPNPLIIDGEALFLLRKYQQGGRFDAILKNYKPHASNGNMFIYVKIDTSFPQRGLL